MKSIFSQINRSTKFILAGVVAPLAIATPALAHPHPGTMETESPQYNNRQYDNNYDTNEAIPPIESYEDAVAKVDPESGMVDVLLKNNTNVEIIYQAVGYTEFQTLEPGEEHVLQDLPVPVTIRNSRADDGFIKVLPLVSNETGMLELSLDEERDYYDNENIGAIRIQEDGQVYLH